MDKSELVVVTLPDGAQVFVRHWDDTLAGPEVAFREDDRAVWRPIELAGGSFRTEST